MRRKPDPNREIRHLISFAQSIPDANPKVREMVLASLREQLVPERKRSFWRKQI